jgi:hypothetical protein
MLGRRERRDRPVRVERGGKGVVDEVDVRVGEQLLIRVVGPFDAEAVCVSARVATGGDSDDDNVVSTECGPQHRRRGDAGGAENSDDSWHEALSR